ncbi:hypothetical protein CVT24_005602 [Panaeolus cyanescens]|uniref:AB hydrolase-1 domain-containing protein n=1 Tax=Panaeolus cyanescens TaxID=181874 RepID=A0A409YXV1_9AGAR|nr:hypothetical protein CVT24_005602 [Panaeolus cyanescens]
MSGFLPYVQSVAKGTLATAAGVSTLAVALVYYGQNYLIYPSAFPQESRTMVYTPDQFGMEYQSLELKTSDEVVLRCYLMTQKENSGFRWEDIDSSKRPRTEDEYVSSRPTVVMFHGNAGNLGFRIPLAAQFYRRMGCNVLMMSYRGYGLSEGSPSEKGLQIDAQTALDYLTTHPAFSKTPIILYGQSIGGAVAIDLASKNPDKIAAIIVENTFTSLPDLVPHVMPVFSRVSFLCHQKWNSASKISSIPATTPILMLSGARDEIVPKEHMRSLWEAVAKRGEKKTGNGSEYKVGLERAKFVEFPHGRHNDTCEEPGYWAAISEFVASIPSNIASKSS